MELGHGRKRPRGMGNPERPRRSAFLITWQGSHRHPMLPTLLEGVAMQTVLSFWAKVAPVRGRGQQRSKIWETWIARRLLGGGGGGEHCTVQSISLNRN